MLLRVLVLLRQRKQRQRRGNAAIHSLPYLHLSSYLHPCV